MNYLAHIYLSVEMPSEKLNEKLLIGNYIADSVKGRGVITYHEDVQKGILFHRAIDTFTDSHPVVEITKQRLRPVYRKYAGVIADVFYDHFLAANWNEYSSLELNDFARDIYHLLDTNRQMLPLKSRQFLAYMIRHNILYKYASFEGVNKALTGLAYRTSFKSGMEHAVLELQRNYAAYEEDFRLFFPELVEWRNNRLQKSIIE